MGHNFQLLLWTLARLTRRTSVLTVGVRRRIEFLPGVLRLSSRRASCCLLRRWRAACDLAFAASDCRCCIFVRLAGASDWYWLSRATSVVKCDPVSCTAAASVHYGQSRRWLRACFEQSATPSLDKHGLSDESCRSPQTLCIRRASGIVALLGSTRLTSAGRRAASRCACEAASSRPATQ